MVADDAGLLERVRALHWDSLVIDAHSDILMALTDRSAGWQDAAPPIEPTDEGCVGQVSLPLLRAGGVTGQVFAVFTAPYGLDYRVVRPEYAGAVMPRALAMLATFHEALARYPGQLRLTTTAAEIRQAKQEGAIAGILGFEGLDPIGHDLRLLRLLRSLGVTIASLTWSNPNQLADGSSSARRPGGLTWLGEDAVRELERLRVLIDLAHLGPAAVDELFELVTRPLLHSHARAANPEQERMLRRLGERGGVACAIFYRVGTVAALADDLERLMELVGPRQVGLGADFYGTRHAPREVQSVADYPRITEELLRRGHDDDTVRGILGENFLRLYHQVVG